jgi:hypothetical protein
VTPEDIGEMASWIVNSDVDGVVDVESNFVNDFFFWNVVDFGRYADPPNRDVVGEDMEVVVVDDVAFSSTVFVI